MATLEPLECGCHMRLTLFLHLLDWICSDVRSTWCSWVDRKCTFGCSAPPERGAKMADCLCYAGGAGSLPFETHGFIISNCVLLVGRCWLPCYERCIQCHHIKQKAHSFCNCRSWVQSGARKIDAGGSSNIIRVGSILNCGNTDHSYYTSWKCIRFYRLGGLRATESWTLQIAVHSLRWAMQFAWVQRMSWQPCFFKVQSVIVTC